MPHPPLQQYILRLQITMYQPRIFQHLERVQQLRREHLDQLEAKPTELVVLDEFV